MNDSDLAGTLLMLANRQHRKLPTDTLTYREHDILALLAHGLPNSEIATRLHISPATVRTHVLNVLRKLDARNRTEAAAMAYQLGLLGRNTGARSCAKPSSSLVSN